MIREAEENDPMLRGRTILGVADPAIFNESQGESIAAMQEKSPNFLHWAPGDNTRLAGKMQFHYRLAFQADGRPMLQVFNTCKHFIRTIPNLVYSESNVEDLLAGEDLNGAEGVKDPSCLAMTTESLTREYPLYTPSLLNLVKTSETHVRGLDPNQ